MLMLCYNTCSTTLYCMYVFIWHILVELLFCLWICGVVFESCIIGLSCEKGSLYRQLMFVRFSLFKDFPVYAYVLFYYFLLTHLQLPVRELQHTRPILVL